jgi:ATP-dependent DNA ligase
MLLRPTFTFIPPALPSRAESPADRRRLVHEIKHDGYRMMVRRDASGVRLLTRNGKDWTGRFPTIVQAAAGLKARSCLIDGEAVCCDKNGLAVFALLRYRERPAEILLYALDLLELDGQDLRREPLETRKATLASLLRGSLPGLRLVEHLAHDRDRRLPPRLPAGLRGHRVEAPGLAVCQRPHTALAQVQEPGGAGGEARGGRGLG